MEDNLINVVNPFKSSQRRDGRFGYKVGQIGPQIGQIRNFFRSDFSTFGSNEPNLPSDP